MPSLMTFPNPRMEHVVVLLRVHSGSSCQRRAALFSRVLELHKSKVYRFSYLDFCATAFIRRIAALCPRNSLVVELMGAFPMFTEGETSFPSLGIWQI